ncbi:MAG: tetratricopeptide repeat protein [Coleofasciculaceae cyanobacterium]
MSLKDIRDSRQKSAFVGREEPLKLFRDNLALPFDDPNRKFIFNIYGQGGVGKTTLLEYFRKIIGYKFAYHAYVDETKRSVPEVMAAIAEQFEQQGHKLKKFSDRYKLYRQCLEEIENAPEAPKGLAGLMGQTAVKVGLKLAHRTPAGVVTDFVDEENVAKQAGEWFDFAYSKLRNKDEVQLVKQPLEVLTPLFLQGLHKSPEDFLIVLFFDTYERTEEFLDSWLRDLIDEKYGECPEKILLVIAGRQELDTNLWDENEGLIARLPLEPFTEQEALDFLKKKGITDEASIQVICQLSGRLPLLVATLAAGKPDNPSTVIDPTETAIERFLKWVEDDQKRQVALDASFPRTLNRDVLGILVGNEQAHQYFNWLIEKPFVSKHAEYWAYHSVVRPQMLRYQRTLSGQNWSSLHSKLANYYEILQNELELSEEKKYKDATWQKYALESLYHRLSESPHRYLKTALNGLVAAFKNSRTFARSWVETIEQVGEETGVAEVQRWAKKLLEGVTAYDEDCYETTIAMFDTLLKEVELEKQWRAAALNWRGYLYGQLKEDSKALPSLSEAILLMPKGAEYWLDRGLVYRSMERFQEAVADFNRAIELNPNYEEAIAHRGCTYQFMGCYQEAIADFDRAIELKPDFDFAIAFRGYSYRLMESYQEALADFNRAIELDPDCKWTITNRGVTYKLMDSYQEALTDFNRVIELDPDYQYAFAERGKTYQFMERYQEALVDFNRAIELDPDDEWVIANRGYTYQFMECYQEAIADFNRAIELKPDDECAITNRGKIHLLMERYQEAIADFNRAIELKPDDEWVIANRGYHYLLTECYQEALADFNRAIELDSKNDWNLYSRSLVYKILDQSDKAQTDLATAIQLASDDYQKNPQNWQNTFNLALYFLANGETEKAENLYRQTVKAAPLNNINDAKRDLADFLKVFPNSQEAKSMVELLRDNVG